MADVSRHPDAGAKPRTDRRWRRAFVMTMIVIGLGAGTWIERETLLQAAADIWIVSDPITSADIAVVLGGGIEVRPFVAADLYERGLVKKIVISQVAEGRTITLGSLSGHTDLNRTVLLKLDVPDSAIDTFGNANRNTMEEAIALREWTQRHAVSAVIIPSDIFSARRVRWTFRHAFSGTSVRIEVPSYEPEEYRREGWWKTEQGLIAFQNEALKYAYYRLKY